MSVLFAYPGQGAQRPGMLAALPDEPPVRACLEQAADCLGQAPAELESAEALRGTRAVQLCLLIAGVAASRLLEARGHRPGLVAGLSIGAYPAAVVAGALDFDDALRLVALRGELMQAAWPEGYGMSAILGLDQAQLDALILMVRREHPPLYLANVNAERQLVVAGSEAALAALAERARAAGASAAKRLAVSVPSHCALLDEPAARLAEAFAGIRLRRPRVPYLSSSRARLVAEPAALADDLAGNMARRVEWLATLRSAYERGARLHLELPPGRVLSGLARPLFGCATPAFEGSRADTLDALLREEEKENPISVRSRHKNNNIDPQPRTTIMIIYGVALLSLCTLAGLFIGEILGVLLGVPANVGGVGIAMLLLIFVGSYLGKRGLLSAKTEQGVEFWSAVYIPIVVAMAAQQNVLGALSGGPAAILAGIAAVAVAFALVPLLDRFGRKKAEGAPPLKPRTSVQG